MDENLLGQAIDAAAAVLRDRPSALISDIDGTLSPIVSMPEEAVVLPECRHALEELAGRLDLVAVISGRTAGEARRMVGLDELLYVGNHGLERWDSANGYRSEATAFEGEMKGLRATLEEELRRIPGARIEDKVTILSLHYRGAPEPEVARHEILDLLGRLLPPGRLAVREGKKVVEIRPPLMLDKGTVMEHLVKERDLRGVVFLGDDRTDVDAMRALNRLRKSGLGSVTIGVAGDEMPDGLAEESDFLLPDPPAVAAFLEGLAQALSVSTSSN